MKFSKDFFFQTPTLIETFGTDLCLKVPLYKRKHQLKPIYINQELYKEYISPAHDSYLEMQQEMASLFQITLCIEYAEKPLEIVGHAYIDRQSDPGSNNFHPGSGRSCYLGKHFNLKGEKTPFALTRDGLMSINTGIWEAVASNSLTDTMPYPIAPVLAILECNHYSPAYFEGENIFLKNAIIVRVNKCASMERVTHVHYMGKKLEKKELLKAARDIGSMEGAKFIERILHGMWSAGNISLNGSFFDMETFCCVKGRHPQYSAMEWYRSNYFGFEYLGQLNVLRALCNNKLINLDSLAFTDINYEFKEGMATSLMNGFLKLMGFNAKEIPDYFKYKIKSLINSFLLLSRKFYLNKERLKTSNPNSLSCSVYDFSKFFRYYPLVKSNIIAEKQMEAFLTLIICSNQINNNYDNYFKREYSRKEEKYLNKSIYKKFSPYIAKHSQDKDSDEIIKKFIRVYDKVHMKIMNKLNLVYSDVEVKSYYLNEDRRYLFSSNKYSYYLSIISEKNINVHFIINQLILACYRNFTYLINNKVPVNIHVYQEGFSCCLMDKIGGFQIHLHIFNADLFKSIDENKISLYFKNRKIKFNLTHIRDINSITLTSVGFKNKELLSDDNFHFQKGSLLALYYEDEFVEMHLLDPEYY
ncbi:hypothetical protein ACFORL_09815 [Legionella dresdenensis]|uniref:Uncharacterized protein n=1 Tax=Legionella dresdenensis TaxID=450200 RepID=A0ABV8CGP6_9GAMM